MRRPALRATAAAAAVFVVVGTAFAPGAVQASEVPRTEAFAGELRAARAVVDSGRHAQALPLFDALLAQRPDDVDLLIEAARVNGFADRNRDAAALYRRALALAPARRADIAPSLAWQTLWSGAAAEALPLFDGLIADGIGPRVEALDGAGQALDALGHHGEAAARFGAAMAQRPDDPRLARRHAQSLAWADRHGEAIAAFDAARARFPADRGLAWLAAHARNQAGRHHEALAGFAAAGGPTNAGERTDVARAWAWAGHPARALPLLADTTDADAAWQRDHRIARELKPYVSGEVDHAIDRDRLEVISTALAAGWRSGAGTGLETLEARVRRVSLRDAAGAPSGTEFQASVRAVFGGPGSPAGSFWPGLVLRSIALPGWTPVTGKLTATWIPNDHLRIDGEAGREWIDAPAAIANRVTVDVASLGADWRATPTLVFTGALASLRFDDGNRRTRGLLRVEQRFGAIGLAGFTSVKPRATLGLEAMAFDATRPTGPGVPGRGYWNPERYDEWRLYGRLEHDSRPWNLSLKLGLGEARETDGDGNRSTGTPHVWEVAGGWDFSPTLRLRGAFGGSGAGLGLSGSGGAGYWRRTASVAIIGWF